MCLYLCKHCLIFTSKSSDFELGPEHPRAAPGWRSCPQPAHTSPCTFPTPQNPPPTATAAHTQKMKQDPRHSGATGGKSHRPGAEKENVTLRLPNSVAKPRPPAPSLVLHPQSICLPGKGCWSRRSRDALKWQWEQLKETAEKQFNEIQLC